MKQSFFCLTCWYNQFVLLNYTALKYFTYTVEYEYFPFKFFFQSCCSYEAFPSSLHLFLFIDVIM